MGRSSARKYGTKVRAREHNHSRQIVNIAKTESGTDDELDFVVGSLGASVGEFELGGSNNGREMALNFHAQVPEHRNPAPLSPSHPFDENFSNLVRASLECQTQVLLEQVSPVEFGVGLGQELQLGLLVLRKVFGIFE